MEDYTAEYDALFADEIDNMVKTMRETIDIPTFIGGDECIINIPKFNRIKGTVLRWHHDHVYTVKLETGKIIVAVANRGEMSYITD